MENININHLEPDEFLVECMVRNIEGSPSEKFDRLKIFFEEEVKNPVLQPFKTHKPASKNPDREIKKCLIKIQDHYNWFVKYDDEELDKAKFYIILSRLCHVIKRLERLSKSTKQYKVDCLKALDKGKSLQISIKNSLNNSDCLNESITFIKENIIIEVEDLSSSDECTSDIESVSSRGTVVSTPRKVNTQNNIPVIDDCHLEIPVSNLEQFHALNINQNLQNSSVPQLGQNLAPSNFQNFNDQNSISRQPLPLFSSQPTTTFAHVDRKIQLSTWKIDFDGRSDGIPVERFLFRVEHFARTYHVSEKDLKDQIGVLLKGSASNWYWCYLERNPYSNWSQLKTAIIERFQDRRTDDDIRRLIDSRKQKLSETFIEFYNEILGLTLRLRNSISDSEILRIIRNNMSSGLQNHLADQDIDSISTLVRRCVALEDMWKRNNYVPNKFCKTSEHINEFSISNENQDNQIPATNHNLGLENFHNFSTKNSGFQNLKPSTEFNSGQFQNLNSTNQIKALDQNSNQPTYYICWNCRDIGHTFTRCPKPQRLFCHGCGEDGVYKSHCPKCSISGNGRMKFQEVALNTSRNPQQQQQPHPAINKNHIQQNRN